MRLCIWKAVVTKLDANSPPVQEWNLFPVVAAIALGVGMSYGNVQKMSVWMQYSWSICVDGIILLSKLHDYTLGSVLKDTNLNSAWFC